MCLSAALLAGCTDSPAAPGDSSSPSMLRGQTVNAIDGATLSGIEVQVGNERAVTTDGTGSFDVEVGGPGSYATVIRGTSVVERYTSISATSGDRLRMPLIPATFDLAAFDQLMRATNRRLQRWTTQPQLVLVATVLSYRGASGEEYPATSHQMSGEEVAEMIEHLTEGLSLLTGGTYSRFSTVTVERPASGERVAAARMGKIVVAEYNGITSLDGTIGYGTWAETDNGSVVAGAMYLDRDFDHDDARRRLLRIHELGHALGYLHVTSRPSIMNPSIGPEPTDFDREAALIGFQRPPGNVAPDTDPQPATSASKSAGPTEVRWSPPVP
ncbi:MAG TPA: hypothetical protein VM818_04905 [Vicinamibacterales bacterium]|nr:hypothetical protein [Vicinamibacterales bacterium]